MKTSALPMATWLVTLFGVALASGATAAREQNAPAVLGVVGSWSEPKNEGPGVVLADGPARQGTSAAEAERIAARLFGKTNATFTANATSPTAFSLGVLESPTGFAQGVYRATFKLVSGASDQTAGLVFDLRPNGEYHYVRYNTKDGNIALWKYHNGNREVIAHGHDKQQLPLGAWHELRLTVTGSRIVATANGVLKLEHDLGRPIAGRVGFWTKRDSVTMFKDIVVEPAKSFLPSY